MKALVLAEASLKTGGSLIGSQAPELEFIWANSQDGLRRLADLRGKVVLLDFWTTWCGPCVGSFPEIRSLAKRDQGLPVEIVGVTSRQGLIYDYDTRGHTVTSKFDVEAAQMITYIRDKNITWTIAFTQEDVFNPRYDVSSIPHAILIDPNGVIRYAGAGVGIGRDAKRHAEKIDALLNEFGLNVPVQRQSD